MNSVKKRVVMSNEVKTKIRKDIKENK